MKVQNKLFDESSPTWSKSNSQVCFLSAAQISVITHCELQCNWSHSPTAVIHMQLGNEYKMAIRMRGLRGKKPSMKKKPHFAVAQIHASENGFII